MTSLTPSRSSFNSFTTLGTVAVTIPARSRAAECSNESILHGQVLRLGRTCANRPRECSKVTVMQDAKTSQYGLVATSRVEAGEVLGEYLGQLRCVPKKTSLRARNQSYMLRMRARSVLEEYVGIDARQLGGRMRFANHSCSANARLFELANGCRHTVVVVVTTQAISPGDEVTVNYGQDLWFVCRCYSANCVHRDIQDQENS
ncbi:hypothetical protein JG688_00002928 [Phytophthora aleatoria]|uniref:SET domain-containing protein n=1 Tax=Phytophthora aleatoria TaxID=2496075 RepID=A0A8J5J033_9STRA|nr:hypothetical protein JG688_00002928 [Phytophthora aleatoria]